MLILTNITNTWNKADSLLNILDSLSSLLNNVLSSMHQGTIKGMNLLPFIGTLKLLLPELISSGSLDNYSLILFRLVKLVNCHLPNSLLIPQRNWITFVSSLTSLVTFFEENFLNIELNRKENGVPSIMSSLALTKTGKSFKKLLTPTLLRT